MPGGAPRQSIVSDALKHGLPPHRWSLLFLHFLLCTLVLNEKKTSRPLTHEKNTINKFVARLCYMQAKKIYRVCEDSLQDFHGISSVDGDYYSPKFRELKTIEDVF